MPFELTSQDRVRAYVNNHTDFDAADDPIEPLKGGHLNYAWRVRLSNPYGCQKSIILKYAHSSAAKVRSKLTVKRLQYEYLALKAISGSSLCDGNTLIGVPTVIHYDQNSNILITQDLGTLPTLHDYFCNQSCPPSNIVTLVATKLAEFIANLHSWGKCNDTLRLVLPPVQEIVEPPIINVLTPTAAKSGIVDPLLEQTTEMFRTESLTSDETLIMGDFWLGNVLIDIEDGPTGIEVVKKLWVIDWEFCRYGNPAEDIVDFAGDCFFLSRFKNPTMGECLRHHYLETYARLATARVDPFRVVVGMGAYWISWAETVGWGDEKEVREYAEIGLEYLRRGKDRSEDWLTTSWAKELGRQARSMRSKARGMHARPRVT
ncbi:kinase-like protein [Leucogyrophana mollusca]|uniref:Kinase-like protein n=1 Tax=Leucogyrophana mollusca TaxID=85980 RepID=A0ACB8B2I8_9AGAM|nr:kinase-like protein [Leucogyrophana mollusca]